MKTIYAFLFVAFCSILSTNLLAQSATESYFLGKWDVSVKGTPQGDVTLPTRFQIKGTSIKGFYTDPDSKEEKPMDTVYVEDDKLNFGFNIAGYDVTVTLSKKDENTATGSLMGMFDVQALRIGRSIKKADNFFIGKWNATIKGTLVGDQNIVMKFESIDGQIKGTFKDSESIQEELMTSVKLKGDNELTMSFVYKGTKITITVSKKTDNTATGKVLELMYDVELIFSEV